MLCGGVVDLMNYGAFGIALVAGIGKFAPSVALGSALFYGAVGDYASLVGAVICLLVRVLFYYYPANGARKKAFLQEKPIYRALNAAVVVFGLGVLRAVQGGFLYYDLFALLMAPLAAGLAAFLFAGALEAKDGLFPYSKDAGVAALLLCGIFAMREVSFFGVYPSAVAAAAVAFLLVAHRGLFLGVIGGALAGLCFDYRMAPAFLLCGLCFGLLEKSSRGGGVLAGSGAAAVYAFAVAGTDGIMEILPALLTAGALFLAGDSAGLVEGSPGYRMALLRRRAAVQTVKAGEQAANEAQLREIAGAFSDLSGTFFELSNHMRRPALSDLRHLCDRSFDKVCPGCRHRDICWGSEYRATAEAVGALGGQLHVRGAVDEGQIPEALAARCRELPSILQSINDGALRLSEEALRGDKTSVVAADYAAMGRILGETLEDGKNDYHQDAAAGERIAERLQRLGYAVETVAVCGKQHRRVILRGIRLPGRHLKLRELRRVLEQHCHFSLGVPEVNEGDGLQDLVFPERQTLRSRTVKETRAKGKGEGRYSGDSVMSFSLKKGYDYAFLCDGMGSGNAAALTSVLASTFLSRLLQAGGRADTALRMLNGFLAARSSREGENSTTVDLLEIDRVSGEASLFKCGAAPTYLLRRGELTRFSSRTAPVGILETLDAERIRFEAEAGDLLVQVSDGVTKGEEECAWLEELILSKWDGDSEALARTILNRAGGGGEDDMSVLVTEIAAAPHPYEETEQGADRTTA